MEDKIQEIMGLVNEIIGCDNAGYQFECKREIQSKLREMVEQCSVREPLSDEEVDALWVFCGNLTVPQKVQRRMIARTVEVAHNIINTTKE